MNPKDRRKKILLRSALIHHHYQIDQEVGNGVSSKVYLAYDINTG
jgi:hypothetical protein